MRGRKTFGDRCLAYSPPNLMVILPTCQEALSCTWYTLMVRPWGKLVERPKFAVASAKAIFDGQLRMLARVQLGKAPPSKPNPAREKLKRAVLTKRVDHCRAQSKPICWLRPGTST